MYRKNLFYFTLSTYLFCACNSTETKKPTEVANNYKPEEVITLWQKSVDINNYEEARKYSTDDVLEYINSMAEASEMDSLSVLNSTFKKIECTPKSDTLTECSTILVYGDGIETNDTYVLAKRNGVWLIKDILQNDNGSSILVQ